MPAPASHRPPPRLWGIPLRQQRVRTGIVSKQIYLVFLHINVTWSPINARGQFEKLLANALAVVIDTLRRWRSQLRP